jgi:hypothetical protein
MIARLTLLAGSLTAGLLLAAAPASAQDNEKMNMVIVYGDDACPPSQGDEITVCARKAESERYRIPEPLRDHASPQNQAWTNRVMAYETVGASGTQSCSPTGSGGWTGCSAQFIHNAYAEKKQGTDVHFSDMLAAERNKRAAVVDSQAAEQQAAVEKAEKEYDARKRAEAAAKAKGDAPADAPAK